MARKKKKDIEKEKINQVVDAVLNHKEELADELIKKVGFSEEDEGKLIKLLIKGSLSITDISEKFNIAKEDVWPAIDKLRARGYEIIEEDKLVILKKEAEVGDSFNLNLPRLTKSSISFLILSDIGIGFKTWQPDFLPTIFEIAEKMGVYFAVVMDVSAGMPRRSREIRDYIQELSNFESQVDYITKYWPKAPFNTYFLNGPKDLRHMTKKSPKNMGFTLGNSREDMRYLGDLATTINIRNVAVAISHTEDDSSVYTKSYPIQGIIRNNQDAIKKVFESDSDNPDIVLLGGLFSLMRIPPRMPMAKERKNNINGFAVPGFYPLTPSQRNRKRQSGSTTVGAYILTLEFNRDGSLKDVIPCGIDLTAYSKSRNYLADVNFSENLTDEEKKILELLIEDSKTKGDLSRKIKKAIPHIEEVIIALKNKGHDIDYIEAERRYKLLRNIKTEFKPLNLDVLFFKHAKFASISDPHLGCVSSRPDLIPIAYKLAEAEDVDKMLIPGDIFEGEKAYRGQERDLTHHGADAQRDLGLQAFPKSSIVSEFITGSSHELAYWNTVGHNIVDTFCRMGRSIGKKLYYLSTKDEHHEDIPNLGFTEINGIGIELIHPTGGIPFGISYRPQKRIEEMVTIIDNDEISEKIMLCGHLHVGFFMIYKGIAGFLVPCLEERTGYLVSKGYIPWLGMWIVDVWQDAYNNITKIIPKYIAFEPHERKKCKIGRKKSYKKAVAEINNDSKDGASDINEEK